MATYSLNEVLEDPAQKRFAIEEVIGSNPSIKQRDPVDSVLIGAGRTLDKLIAGGKQVAYGVASKLGSKSADKALEELAEDQRQKDKIYSVLQQQRPFLSGLGESLPTLVIPAGGAATAAGRMAMPAIINAGIGAASYGSAKERAANATLNGITGGMGGGLGELTSRAIRPLAPSLAQAPKAAEDAAKRIGWQPSTGQRSGSSTIQALEDSLSQMPGGAGVFGRLREANQRAVNRAASKAIGQDTDAITQDVLQNAKTAIATERNALQIAASADPTDPHLLSAIAGAKKDLEGGSKTLATGTPGKVIDEFDEFLSGKKGPITGAEYQAWRTDFDQAKTAAFKSGDGKAAAAYQRLKQGLDDAVRRNTAHAWEGNDKLYGSYKLLTKRPNTVNEVTGDVSAPLLSSSYLQRFGDTVKRGGIAGPLADISAVTRGFNQMREGSQTARRQAFDSIIPWAMSPATFVASKTLTSPAISNWMAYGLLSTNPTIQAATIKGMRNLGVGTGMATPAGLLNIDGY